MKYMKCISIYFSGYLTGAFIVSLMGFATGCGGKAAVCGDGVVDPGEDCDRGAQNGQPGINCSKDCKSVSVNLVNMGVTWSFDLIGKGEPVPGYQPPGCSNFGATKAHVIIDGPSPSDKIVECTRYTLKYPTCLNTGTDAGEQCDMMPDPGDYKFTVQLLRDDLTAVTNSISTEMMAVNPGPEVDFAVSFQMQDFLVQDFKGTLDFHASWGAPGQGCKGVNPPVTQESILLIPDKLMMPIQGMTKLGTKLDGTPGACFTSDNISNTYEEIDNLPWGRYRLSVYSNNPSYCVSVPVYVNPGMFNTTYEIVVPSYTAPAMDGGVSDGGASDGGAPTCP